MTRTADAARPAAVPPSVAAARFRRVILQQFAADVWMAADALCRASLAYRAAPSWRRRPRWQAVLRAAEAFAARVRPWHAMGLGVAELEAEGRWRGVFAAAWACYGEGRRGGAFAWRRAEGGLREAVKDVG